MQPSTMIYAVHTFMNWGRQSYSWNLDYFAKKKTNKTVILEVTKVISIIAESLSKYIYSCVSEVVQKKKNTVKRFSDKSM